MNDIIHLLSDAVANQIAAGEVVQRPASAVKELLENAVDAGASDIQLIVKDAGRTMIQVVDNGKGMSFNDARLCFERHATSKIKNAEDLFSLQTKGFRGEALASIAAIAHVELKTKQADNNLGTLVRMEGGVVKEHAPAATQDGTSVSVKNLFFNVPARRNFLKSDSIEFSHIEEEFNRVALVHEKIAFSFYHNDKLLFQLKPSSFKQRIIGLFGQHFNEKLFPVDENTDFLNISGFISRPENAKKKKNEQYMFINNRFIRHPLLNYAVETAYKELVPEGYKPAYFIKLDLDPATVDINISPTKVEAKLQDERLVFGFLNSVVKKTLGMLSLTPQFDFDCPSGMDFSNIKPKDENYVPSPGIHHDYNPFASVPSSSHFDKDRPSTSQLSGWNDFMKSLQIQDETEQDVGRQTELESLEEPSLSEKQTDLADVPLPWFALNAEHIVLRLHEQLCILDVQNARERILYEQYLHALAGQAIAVQQSLFPETVSFSPAKAELLLEIKDDLHKLGYDIEPINQTEFAVNGTPNDVDGDSQDILENLLELYKTNLFLYRSERNKNVAISMARQKKHLFKPIETEIELKEFLQQLFACQVPYTTPDAKKTMYAFTNQEINKIFEL